MGIDPARPGGAAGARLYTFAVVDPGVGTERLPVILASRRGDMLVGPDNGLLIRTAEALGGLSKAWAIETQLLAAHTGLTGEVSSTFHGRDIFAPAAAMIAVGTPPSELGRPLDPSLLVRLAEHDYSVLEQGFAAEVVEVDRFGNVGLAATFDDCPFPAASVRVEVEGEGLPEWDARVVQTFGQLLSGELGIYRDSWGKVALALNGASAAQLLSVGRGMVMRITARESG